MNHTIISSSAIETVNKHMMEVWDKLEKPLKRYKFTFIHDGEKKERITKGESLADAKKSLGYYFPGDITFLGWKELL